MSERRGSRIDSLVDAYRQFPAEQLTLLLKRARSRNAAPKAVTGCLSEISTCARLDHGYAHALKAYGAVYEAAQAYLTPGEGVAHDYSGYAQGEQDVQGAQVAAQLELLLQHEPTPVVSDDDVESCGYFGWLRH